MIPFPSIADRLFDRPLLAHPRTAYAVYSLLAARMGLPAMAWDDDGPDRPRLPPGAFAPFPAAPPRAGDWQPYIAESGLAWIPVEGVLVNKGAWIGTDCGMTSYQGLRHQFDRAAADPDIRVILADYDTGGGECSGCFDLARRIRAISREKSVISVCSDHAYSAGYALASAGSHLFAPRSGGVGSIGVIGVHIDQSRAMEMAGLKPTLIHAGARKADGNPFEALPADVRAEIEEDFEAARMEFAELVADHRGLSVAAVLETEARCYRAGQALSAGLIDGIASNAEVAKTLLADLSGTAAPAMIAG